MSNDIETNLAKLREPFPANLISKLPKPTKKQTEEVRANYQAGIRCEICGGWHHPNVVHLDYVGHAALTDRLLDVDPCWNWEPLAEGVPVLDTCGGMWIKLTVCGLSRLGYGHATGKQGGDAIKEVIGDAIRNAAMRFGAALDLWHKGDLHAHHEDDSEAADTSLALAGANTLLAVMSEGNDINTVQFWRNLNQEQQQREWKTIDKETQKHLKALMAQHPVPMEQAS